MMKKTLRDSLPFRQLPLFLAKSISLFYNESFFAHPQQLFFTVDLLLVHALCGKCVILSFYSFEDEQVFIGKQKNWIKNVTMQ